MMQNLNNIFDGDDMKKHLTPIKAIRQNCMDCSGGSVSEVRNCIITDCPLYSYRLGRNPNRKVNTQSSEVNSKNVS